MRQGQPFSRLRATMALISAVMAAYPHPGLGQRQALAEATAGYRSRGKGGKTPHRKVGTKAFQRAALKRRNQSATR